MTLFKRSYFKHAWKVILVISAIAFIVGQFAIYLFYGVG